MCLVTHSARDVPACLHNDQARGSPTGSFNGQAGGSRASAGWRQAAATGGSTTRAGSTFQSRGQAGSTFTFTTGRYGSDPFAAAKEKAAKNTQRREAQGSSSSERSETESFDEMKPWTWRVVH